MCFLSFILILLLCPYSCLTLIYFHLFNVCFFLSCSHFTVLLKLLIFYSSAICIFLNLSLSLSCVFYPCLIFNLLSPFQCLFIFIGFSFQCNNDVPHFSFAGGLSVLQFTFILILLSATSMLPLPILFYYWWNIYFFITSIIFFRFNGICVFSYH